jgi:hypothetical protein
MQDELRRCECGKQHHWGILSKRNGVPQYGARPRRDCKNFRPKALDQLPAIDTRELWAQTGDLCAQATTATRIAVMRLKSLARGKQGYSQIAAQWPEFIGFVISQITDLRGSLVRADNKFAHLVAHTDDVVEQLRKVGPLAQKLNMQTQMLAEVIERLDRIEELGPRPPQMTADALSHFGLIDEGLRAFYDSLTPKWASSRSFELAGPADKEEDIGADEADDADDDLEDDVDDEEEGEELGEEDD